MKQLLVDTGTSQFLLTVHKTGRYHDMSKVIWDSSKQGEIPANLMSSLGGLEVVGGQLVVNPTKLAAFQAANQAKIDAETQKNQRVQQARQNLNQANLANNDPDLTPQQIRQLFRFIRVILKDVSKALD